MKLSDTQKLRIRRAYLSADILRLWMWLNVIYEFDAFIQVWRATLNRIDSEVTVSYKDALLYIKHYIYTDFSDKRLFPGKPLFLTQLFLVLSELNVDRLTKYFPVEYHVKSKDRTSRSDYKKEKLNYKLCHSIACQGRDLKYHFYEQYKCIAIKYNWPFIVNSDDPDY
jgi:hypothetical protein